MSVTLVVKSNKLPQIAKKLPVEANRIVRETAFEIKRIAQIMVAVDTGNLKNSITAEQYSAFVWIVYTTVAYARYVEEGTYRMEARPYFRPGVEHGRQVLEQGLKELERLLV